MDSEANCARSSFCSSNRVAKTIPASTRASVRIQTFTTRSADPQKYRLRSRIRYKAMAATAVARQSGVAHRESERMLGESMIKVQAPTSDHPPRYDPSHSHKRTASTK